MESIDITQFFSYSEDGQVGDYRQFHIYCPYIEDGRGSQFHREWRVTGTEEEIIGDAGIDDKKQKTTAAFERHLISDAKRNSKHFEVQDGQLWLCAGDS